MPRATAASAGVSSSFPAWVAELVAVIGFTERKKRPVIANVAVARELAGWCWSLATLNDIADQAPATSGAGRR